MIVPTVTLIKTLITSMDVAKKINLYLDFEDALTLADEDLNENWGVYKERFLSGGFP